MLAFAGILVVLAAVLGGYIAEKGNPYVLLQPAELLIVCGSAIGIILIANRPSLIRQTVRGIGAIFFPPRRNKQSVLRSLRMLYEVFSYAQRAGVMALESHVEEPQNSSIFSRYPELLSDPTTLRFLCDSWRMLVIGATTPLELDHLMDLDIEIQRRDHLEPVHALSTVADSVPGLGIMAAVLGVVITMQSIGSSPETVGEKVAARWWVRSWESFFVTVWWVRWLRAFRGLGKPIRNTSNYCARQRWRSPGEPHPFWPSSMVAVPCRCSTGPALTKWKSQCDGKPRFRRPPHCPERQSMASLHAPVDPPASAVGGRPYRHRRPEQHRGGAWKVAYADFVTALMALFIVLWMMNASEKVKQAVRGYFLDPRGYTRQLGAGLANSGEGLRVDARGVRDVCDRIEQALRQMPDFEVIRNNVVVSVTGEGLRIDLLENEQGMFFVSGDPTPTNAGVRLLKTLAGQLSRMPNSLVIEGHTDARPFRKSTPSSGYGNWDLAADRANTARRLLHAYGVGSNQVVEMRGFADRRLLFPGNPNDPRNRRVSLVVKFAEPGG